MLYSILAVWQISPDKAREEFRSASQKSGGGGMKDLMDSMGLGMLADQVSLTQQRNSYSNSAYLFLCVRVCVYSVYLSFWIPILISLDKSSVSDCIACKKVMVFYIMGLGPWESILFPSLVLCLEWALKVLQGLEVFFQKPLQTKQFKLKHSIMDPTNFWWEIKSFMKIRVRVMEKKGHHRSYTGCLLTYFFYVYFYYI